MKKMLSLFSIFYAACFLASLLPLAGHQAVPVAAGIPESLLDGKPDFNLAVLLQGDLRGSYGPCG
jgi:hypothetical protein